MHRCVVCGNTSNKTSSNYNGNVAYHAFPRIERLKYRWVQNLKLPFYAHWQRVCSEHFECSDFRPGYRNKLWPDAVPKLPKNNISVTLIDSGNSSTSIGNDFKNNISVTLIDSGNSSTSIGNDFNNNISVTLIDSGNSSTSIGNDFKILTQINQEIEQSRTLARKSNRKIKPVKIADGVLCQIELLCKKKQSKNKFPTSKTLIKCNTPMQGLNTSHFKRNNLKKIKRCSVLNCENNSLNSNYSFFSYPQYEEFKKIWKQNCGAESNIYANGVNKKNPKVCGYHFKEDAFINPDKKNRLKIQAIPTLFDDYVVSSNQSLYDKNGNQKLEKNKFGINQFQSISIVNEDYIGSSEEIHKKMKLLNIFIASKNLHLYCCVPGCINSNKDENKNMVCSLFKPAKEAVNDWSKSFDMDLTENSILCERHFEVEDLISHSILTDTGKLKIKTLISGAMPNKFKINKKALKRHKNYNANKELLVKKHKTHLIDESKAFSQHDLFKKSEEIKLSGINFLNGISNQTPKQNNEVIDVHPLTSTDDFTSSSLLSNFKQELPEISVNSTLVIDDSNNLKSEPETTLASDIEPNTDIHPLTSTDDFTSSSLLSNFKQELPEISVNSTLVIDDSNNLKPERETTLASDIKPNTDIHPLTSTDGFISSSLLSNFKQELLEIAFDSTLIIDDSNNVKPEPETTLASDIKPNTDIHPLTSTDDFTSSSLLSNFKQELPEISVNSTLIIDDSKNVKPEPETTLASDIKPNTDIHPLTSTDDFTSSSLLSNFKQELPEISVNSTLIIDDSKNVKPKPETTLASDIEPNILLSANEQLLSKNKEKLEQKTEQLFESMSPNLNQNEEPRFISECFSPSSSKIWKYDCNFGTNDSRHEKTHISTNDFNYLGFEFIYDIYEKVVLPSNLWNIVYDVERYVIGFLELNDELEPIKTIFFQKSLVPEININNNRYNYEKAVTSQSELENLLNTINDINVCLGYNGQFHENCIRYFGDNVEEEVEIEVCYNCRKLIKSKHSNIPKKIHKIELLKIEISKMEYSLMESRKQLQQNKI